MSSASRTKGILFFLSALAVLGLMASIFPLRYATAERGQSEIGRYQLSSWASYSGAKVHHSGYYVIDTLSGKIVDKGHEIHGISGRSSSE